MARYRLTGVSGGAAGFSGGVQWDIGLSDRDIVVAVIDDLEDRRMLWETITRERADHCAASASYMRTLISSQLKTPGISPPLKAELKTLRRHFATFMTNMSDAGLDVRGPVNPDSLERVLGWLRSAVGEQLGLLAAQYSIEVDKDLASIIPNQNSWFFEEFSP